MKNSRYLIYIIISGLFMWSCTQEEEDVLTNPDFTPTTPIPPPSAGSADFTKFVAVGNSLIAGFQAAALFDEGQANSLAVILNASFQSVGGGDFNQPGINSENGFNSTFSDPLNGIILGRLVLFDGDGDPETTPLPTPAGAPGVPAPFNTADLIGPRTDTLPLNNFGVPGARVLDAVFPGYATLNPFFGRFASTPAATIVGDAATAQGTFFMMWLGNNDVLGYATAGAAGPDAETDGPAFEADPDFATITLTSIASFTAAFQGALGAMTLDPTNNGVVANIPDVTDIPFFTTVTWDAIEFDESDPVDAATIAALNSITAFGGFNASLDGLALAGAITQDDADSRKVVFADGANSILIEDEELADISAALAGINPALAIYGQARQATAADLITLSAGSVLGTLADPNDPTTAIGVAVPLEDQYVLIPSEIDRILTRTSTFNMIISDAISLLGVSDRVAMTDMNKAFSDLTAAGGGFVNGVLIAPSFAPPAGLFSEDGVHPNSRGYAYAAQFVIEAINAKFGATIPMPSIANYAGTGLPLMAQ